MAFWSNASLKSIGVLFTKVGLKSQGDALRSAIVDTAIKKGSLINKYKWFKVRGKYIADGGEKYITIGNFTAKFKNDFVKMNIFRIGFKEADYFIDDIAFYLKEDVSQVDTIYLPMLFDEEQEFVKCATFEDIIRGRKEF